jgi:acetyl-CoA C-acetyltransferase
VTRDANAGSHVVICEPVRTPIGRYGGALSGLQAADLGTRLLTALMTRTGLDPEEVDDVIVGHSYPTSEAPALGRVIALNAGLPTTVPGMQIDRRCGSGLQAVLSAAQGSSPDTTTWSSQAAWNR